MVSPQVPPTALLQTALLPTAVLQTLARLR